MKSVFHADANPESFEGYRRSIFMEKAKGAIIEQLNYVSPEPHKEYVA